MILNVKTHSKNSRAPAPLTSPTPLSRPRRILVVDDEAFILTTIAHKLRQRGYEVVTAADGQEALSLAREAAFDLVVSDYQMPLLSGFDLCVRLRDEGATARVPVIMLTARGHRLGPAQLAQTNIKFLLPKPFSAKDLIRRIEEIIGPASAAKVA
jgi:two-component system phosphate regulon response regulator PhoB